MSSQGYLPHTKYFSLMSFLWRKLEGEKQSTEIGQRILMLFY